MSSYVNRKEMYDKQNLERKEERAKYREKVKDPLKIKIWIIST